MRRRAGEQETDGTAGERPELPAPQIERPELLGEIMDALRARHRTVAVTGPAGAGKTVMAARACLDRRLRRYFGNRIVWLEAGEKPDPVELLAALAHRLRMTSAAITSASVERARELLQPVLAGKRLLIVVDNVSERAVIDAFRDLAPSCTVMVTSRVPELAALAKAAQIQVDRLTPEQSLELLGLWTGHDVATLPPEAELLCAKSGGLALAVAVVGGMARTRPIRSSLELVERFLDRAQSGSGTAAGSEPLPHLIAAGIAAMPKARRSRYEKLAVFAGRGAFPAVAAHALWYRKPHGAAVPLLDSFVSRGMLIARGAGWYLAHDLHYNVLKGRLGEDGLVAAHAQLLDGYRIRYRHGWTESAGDPYLARNLAGHMRDARLSGELRTVLTNQAWIQARLARGPAHELIHDYRHSVDPLTRQVMRALRLEAASRAADPERVGPQLTNRLLSRPDPGIRTRAAGATRAKPLTQILTGHTGAVRSVAVSHDGSLAVSGSDDGTVRVWDLAAGTERAALTGHDGEVFAVAITVDGRLAVSGGSDRILRIWDLDHSREWTILAGHTRPVWSVAVVADTRAVSASGDGTIRVWDLATGTERDALAGHDGQVFALAITPDGDRAVSGDGNGTISQWSKTAGLHTVLAGHTGSVRSVALAQHVPLAVSGGEDASVRVWDLTTGTERAALTGHDRDVFAVAITPDGDRAVSGGGDETVRVWDLTATGPACSQPFRPSTRV